MQFPVPQFIDSEDKLIGPFSLKQFGFIFVPGLILAALFRVFKISIPFFILGLPVLILGVGLAFGQFNGKPLYNQFPIFIKWFTMAKSYVFHKDPGEIQEIKVKKKEEVKPESISPVITEGTQSRLKKLSLILDQKSQEEYKLLKK